MTAFCSLDVLMASSAASSAYEAVILLAVSCIVLLKRRYTSGPWSLPCVTSARISFRSEHASSYLTRNFHCVTYDFNQTQYYSRTIDFILCIRP